LSRSTCTSSASAVARVFTQRRDAISERILEGVIIWRYSKVGVTFVCDRWFEVAYRTPELQSFRESINLGGRNASSKEGVLRALAQPIEAQAVV
jgi:hypothetical protein